MISKLIMIIIIFIGIMFITVGVIRNDQQCPKQEIIYRYIPRTFEDEQNEPVYVSDIFKTMFSQPSAWVQSLNDVNIKKHESINKYFVNQY